MWHRCVGKTQIALNFATQSREQYNIILWVATDSTISVGDSFRPIACELGLTKSNEEVRVAVAAILKVKNWLTEYRELIQTLDESCLFVASTPLAHIFDNADDPETLRPAWPAGDHGCVLITTRNFDAAHSFTSSGLQVEPFNKQTGAEVLLRILGLDVAAFENQERAVAISKALCGLPLALIQIDGFILQRRIPLQNFLPLCERNASKIDSKKSGLTDYEYTLSTVWSISLSQLADEPRKLLNLLIYFKPDAIRETVLFEGSKVLNDEAFDFLRDEFEYVYKQTDAQNGRQTHQVWEMPKNLFFEFR